MAKQGSKTHRPPREPPNLTKVATGIAGLDDILEGGFPAGRTTLISGGPDTGKTTLACTFVRSACARGEKVLYISFEESGLALMSTMLSPSVDLRPAARTGCLDFITIMPEAMGAKQQGITVLMTNQLAGNFEQIDFSGLGFSSRIDTIILLRFVEIYNKITRSLLILKGRGTKHSNIYHRFVITDHGIEMTAIPSGARLSELQGQPSTGRSYVEAGVRNGGEQ